MHVLEKLGNYKPCAYTFLLLPCVCINVEKNAASVSHLPQFSLSVLCGVYNVNGSLVLHIWELYSSIVVEKNEISIEFSLMKA